MNKLSWVPRLVVPCIAVFGLLSVSLVVYSQWLTSRDFNENANLIRLTQAIQQEVATAHLWFEEALGGDATIDYVSDVHRPLLDVVDRIDIELATGAALDNSWSPSVRSNLMALKANVLRLIDLAEARWVGRESTGQIGGTQDQMFDAIFAEIMYRASTISDDVELFIEGDRDRLFIIDLWTVVILVTALIAVMTLVMWNRRLIDGRTRELEGLVEQRTALLTAKEAETREQNVELKRARDAARQASEAKSQFLANMSHEIRTPMNGVLGMTSLLSRTKLSETQRAYVETMHSSGIALLTIINDVLDYSKLEAGKLTLVESEFVLRSILDDTLHLFSAAAARKNVTMTASVAPDVPVSVRGDVVRLGEILSNLVSNAIKFSDRGEIRIECSRRDAAAGADEGIELLFEVSDQGVGIAPGDLPKLFENFSQVDDSPTRAHGGTGLGLAICKALAGLMHGEIGVRSARGQGSTFWFTVRLSAATGQADARSLRAPAGTLGSAAPGIGQRRGLQGKVLVVDDNRINLVVAQRMLEELGFQVDLASDGPTAIEFAAASRYAAILVDSQMPGMSGEEVTRHIRQSEGADRHTPIIALTASVLERDRERAFAAGVDDYLRKPLFMDDMEIALSRVLSRPVASPADATGDGSATGREHDSSQPVLDVDIVEELQSVRASEGDADLFTVLAGYVVEEVPTVLEEIRVAANRHDARRMRRLAHKLTGSFRQIGAFRLAELCAALQATDLDCDDRRVAAQLNSLQAEYRNLSVALASQRVHA